ncbi:MAG: uroporphyrinogen decarboxylase family protein [Clostridiales bacterium]|jgi:uroporphyrinogen decarboxylase|nr:uroporphyrinogen-III decarboxylase [Eubacteriales bacterium]MDH7566971.1 uroporphyrinogen decarboxylase family protein [Clostridiales bacterium]
MTNQEMYQLRLDRIKKAIKLEKPDKTPFVPVADSFYAKLAGVTLADFITSAEASHKAFMYGAQWLGDVEAVSFSYSGIGDFMGAFFFSKMKLPGRELGENVLWQFDEQELMSTEDYDTILKGGFRAFAEDFYVNRLHIDFEKLAPVFEVGPQYDQEMRDLGYPMYDNLNMTFPIDCLSGGRTMAKFMVDIRRMPEKIIEVLDIVVKANIEDMKNMAAAWVDPLDVWFSMGRACPDFYSTKIWEKFVWKYLKEEIEACIEIGIPANLHIDANWERALPYFKELPKGTCVFETDGTTDIYKVKEVLGDKMCIKGDVQAAKLVLATAEDVYKYSCQLIKDMGPGFILSSGCSIPYNAKPENVKAMVAAASGK